MSSIRAFFFRAVAGHGFRQRRAGRQTAFKHLQIFGKRSYLMEILHGVRTQVITREPALGPSLVKGMAQQIMLGDAGIKFFLESVRINVWGIHFFSLVQDGDLALYVKTG